MSRDDHTAALQRALAEERAGALGRMGRAVERALAELRALAPQADAERRDALVWACADAVWQYFVQREACGLRRHDAAVEAYAIPREVLARVGGRPRAANG